MTLHHTGRVMPRVVPRWHRVRMLQARNSDRGEFQSASLNPVDTQPKEISSGA